MITKSRMNNSRHFKNKCGEIKCISNGQLINGPLINGPVNVIRIEGVIFGIRKIIYLFLDKHNPLAKQTKCGNIFSTDVDKFFLESFINLSKRGGMVDFFVELQPSEIVNATKHNKYIKKQRYIDEVVYLFNNLFKYDPSVNKVNIGEYTKNVRLHYLDIREYFQHNIESEIIEAMEISNKFLERYRLDTTGIRKIINIYVKINKYLIGIRNVLIADSLDYKKKKLLSMNNNNKLYNDEINYIANKIKFSYKHTEIKNFIDEQIKKSILFLDAMIEKIDRKVDNYYDIIEKMAESSYNNKKGVIKFNAKNKTLVGYVSKMIRSIEKLWANYIIEFFARFTDIYFMRRFLDKDYITTAVVYSGVLHSATYIDNLIKYFDFKITHASYASVNTKSLTNKIKKSSINDILQYILPDKIVQCSDISDFPESFL